MIRVAVLHNAPVLAEGHHDYESEADVVAVAQEVGKSLEKSGYDVELVAVAAPIAVTLSRLIAASPDVVFNLVEGYNGASGGEAHVTSLLELLGLSYTGCPPGSMTLGHSKGRTKALLRGLDLPTAAFKVVEAAENVPRWDGPWPVIVKPESEDASLGIDQASVVQSPEALDEVVARIKANLGGNVLVEAYLPGREFNVGLLALPELEALPVAEIVFDMPPGFWPILTYDAKWSAGSVEDRASVPVCPADLDPSLSDKLGKLAARAFRATGCRDYARVDFRLDALGQPMILEVNPNPDLAPRAGWARALRASGRDYDATLAALVEQARARSREPLDG